LLKIKQTELHKDNHSKINSKIYVLQHYYILVDKRVLHVGDKLDFSLFIPDKPTSMSLFLQSNTVINRTKQQKLKDIEQVYVLKSQKDQYNFFLEEYLQTVIKDNSTSLDEKTSIIYASTKSLTRSLYENPNGLENLQQTKKLLLQFYKV
jgi:hypothetical protein